MREPRKKTARQLETEIARSLAKRLLLPADWPDVARAFVTKAARWYHHESHEPWAVPEVHLDQALEEVYEDLEREDRDRDSSLEDARPSWRRRFEHGTLDSEIKKAILAWSSAVKHGTPKM